MGWFTNSSNNNKKDQQKYNHYNTQNENPQNTSSFHSYFRSYSTSTTCKDDPQDINYMICTQKINDGNNKYQTVNRIQKSQMDNNIMPNFGSMFFNRNSQNIQNMDKSMQQMQSQMNSIFQNSFPFMLSALFPNFNFSMKQNNNFYHPPMSNQYTQTPSQSQNNANYFTYNNAQNKQFRRNSQHDRGFSFKQKDTGVRDL